MVCGQIIGAYRTLGSDASPPCYRHGTGIAIRPILEKANYRGNPVRLSSQNSRTLLPVQAAPPVRAAVAPGRMTSRCAVWLAVFSCAAACLGIAAPARGQGIDREYQLKAVYLYKFATYIQWPEGAFRDAASPFVIGILGPDRVGADLRKIAKVKKIDGRKIDVRNYQQAEEVRDCHIFFMPRALKSEIRQAAVKLLSGRNLLLVGETPDILKHGGVIDFVIQENRIRIYISKSAYEREGLEISAQLLRIATIVK